MKPLHPYANIERDMMAHDGQMEFDFSPKTYKGEDVTLEINGVKVEGFSQGSVITIDKVASETPWYARGKFRLGDETLMLRNNFPLVIGSLLVIDQEYAYIYAGNFEAVLCNGRELARSSYAQLYAVIGHERGIASSKYNFILPNYMNKFPEKEYKRAVFLQG